MLGKPVKFVRIAVQKQVKKKLSERTHNCSNCGYTTDRDVAAAQIVLQRGLAAVGHTVKMLAEGKFIGIPAKQESPRL